MYTSKLQCYFALMIVLGFISCNRKTTDFKQLTGFSPGTDVHNIQYKDDVLSDAIYWLAFDCNAATAEKVKLTLALSLDTEKNRDSYASCCYFPKQWWDTAAIARSPQYSTFRNGSRIFFWYHPETKKAFLLKIIP
ncbi:hypothetical protein [Taibaiella sp. KBW10]|uniref:hypothetical protein n=1 Tax=Taibaiella sp. KBW10 TaxID=2153357 RepID=UPI000F59E202|nr:hypothetical protein [Taibaiella sp. KBW10]